MLTIFFTDNTSFITTIYSAEGDEIKLKNDVCMKSSVEVKRTINLFIVAPLSELLHSSTGKRNYFHLT